jgi:cardiolipin synthase
VNAPWREGNRVDLLENGEEFFPRVLELVASARSSIYIETFILCDDCVGRDLSQALVAAAARGVAIDVLADGFGSDGLPPAYRATLAEAGIRLHLFEPRRRIFGVRTNLLRRMHRKITLIDARVALLGGINYCSDHLVEQGEDKLHDFAVEVEGPVVADIVDFVQRSATSPSLPRLRWWQRRGARRAAPVASAPMQAVGEAKVKFVTRDNHRHRSDIEREYRDAIRGANDQVTIANAYFFPGYRLLRDLRDAARRGARVTVIVQGKPDMRIVTVVARWLYHYLVPAGVRVLEYCERPLHAKVATIDRDWSTVGSSNLDPLSLSLNLEANVVIRDAAFREALQSKLQRLIDCGCEPVTLKSVPARTPWRILASAIVFHFLRHFPRWAEAFPSARPRIEPAPGNRRVTG